MIFFVAIKTSTEQDENIVHNWFSISRLSQFWFCLSLCLLWLMLSKYSLYYQGNDHMEYLGLDGYNYSSSQGTWTTIQNVFHKSLTAIRSNPGIDPNKPLVIAETGTTEPDANSAAEGHSKAEWFTNCYGNMGWWLHNEAPQFGVAAVLYFDYADLYTGKKSIPDKNDFLIHDPSLPSAFESVQHLGSLCLIYRKSEI